jgi:L-cysteine S-thiosulfotransferase
MKTTRTGIAVIGLTVSLGLAASAAVAAEDWGQYKVEDRRSGYTYMTDETRAMQNDNFQNPGMLWVEDGEALWSTADGEAGKSCADCHGTAADSMKGVGASYPKYSEKLGKPESIEQRINRCRTENMKAKEWKWESKELLAMTTFVNHQSLGMPVNVEVDGKAKPFFEKGKEFYYERRGQLDMACANCHEDYPGGQLRANTLSEGQGNGFPTYRLKWQKVGSLHRRFRGCNKQVRAKPFGYGSDEYVNLELFVKWRARGLPVETPAVRN